jgi:hypothetical protein
MLDRLGRAWARRVPVTSFSAGVAVYSGGNPDVVLRRADEALYQAKKNGRSCAWVVEYGSALEDGQLLPLPARPFDPARPTGAAPIGAAPTGTAPSGTPTGAPVPRPERPMTLDLTDGARRRRR